MLGVGAEIDLIAGGDHKFTVGIHIPCSLYDLVVGLVMACPLSLRIAQVEEGKGIVAAACSLDNTRFAPPALFGVADTVAVLRARLKAAELDGVQDVIRLIRKQPEDAKVCAGVASGNRFT